MSASEETPFLQLPLFTATDKPTWLGDFDSAMTKVDTGVANLNNELNKLPSQISVAVDTANDAKTAADAARSDAEEAKTAAGAAAAAAANALNVANNAQKDVNYFDITRTGNLTNSAFTVPAGAAFEEGNMQYALNTEGTYGKLYGNVLVRNVTGGSNNTVTIKAGYVPFTPPSKSFNLNFTAIVLSYSDATKVNRVSVPNVSVNADGTIVMTIPSTVNANDYVNFIFIAVPIYFHDFGDVETQAMYEKMFSL